LKRGGGGGAVAKRSRISDKENPWKSHSRVRHQQQQQSRENPVLKCPQRALK